MTNLVQSLFRIDPTEGLVQYASAVKPYHSKILDVLVEYIYSEKIDVTMKERWSWKMTFERPKVDVVRTCGYGLVWDPYKNISSAPPVNIVSSQSTMNIPVVIRATADDTEVSTSAVGYTLVDGMPVTVSSTGTLPVTNPQVAPGIQYIVQGHNASFRLVERHTGEVVHFLSAVTGNLMIHPSDVPFNSFLVEPNYGPDYDVSVINTKANQLAFTKSYTISGVNTTQRTWTVGSDVRPTFPVVGIKLDDVTITNIAGNCCFVFDGNAENYFPPDTTFTVIGGPNAGNYVVAGTAADRILTRYDGKQTIVPVNQSIPTNTVSGTARVGLNVVFPIGTPVFVSNNTGIGGNGRYTVASVSIVGGTTVFVVNENVSMLSAPDGKLSVVVQPSNVPAWPYGVLVTVTSSGALPPPLANGGKYFYIPTSTPGQFNLSTKRYPTELSDYIDLLSVNSGDLKVKRAEIFNPGAYVKVSGSYLSKNDGNYIIRKTTNEGQYVRVYVMEKVSFTTPQNRPYDGVMEFNFESYDSPSYCPVAQCGDMYADTFIHEKIMFEYSIQLKNDVSTTASEYTFTGFGTSPYGTPTKYGLGTFNLAGYSTVATGSVSAPTGTILPHGIDVQLFDVGGLEETIPTVKQFYGAVV